MSNSATIVISSYESKKITKTISEFKKFTVLHKLQKPIIIDQPRKLIEIPGCNYNDLKRKSINIKGLDTLTNLHTVKAPKGVVLQFI